MSTTSDSLHVQTDAAAHPLDSGVAGIAALVRDRVISPAELCEEALRRLSEWEPTLNAFITVCGAAATARAERLGKSHAVAPGARPLLGVPLAVKDNIDVIGERTTAGSVAIDYHAYRNATSVQRLHTAGAVVVGKTNLPELAYGPTDDYAFGPTWNPWKSGHFAGGSSMGSGAAVAAGIVPAALGSDTSGSLRNPAGWSGVTGLKPTAGLVPVTGMVPLAPGLDHVGPMARTALDCAILLDALAGFHSADPWSHRRAGDSAGYADVAMLPPSPSRIGVVQSLFDLVSPDAREVMETALNTMASLGAQLVDVEIPLWEQAADAALLILACRAATTHADLLAAAPELLTSQTRERLEAGTQVSSGAYVQADFTSHAFRRNLAAAFQDIEYLVLPARERTAPPMQPDGLRPPGDKGHLFNTPFNLTGSPAIVMPVGFDAQGLPVGIQLAANRWRDASLLRYAHAFQSVTDWHMFRPPMPPPLPH